MNKENILKCNAKPRIFSICEFIGSMFLVIAAIAPMILFYDSYGGMPPQNALFIAIVADSIAVGFVLFALIEIFGPICTAYFNPAVCLAMVLNKELSFIGAIKHSFAQILGGIAGLLACHLMFYDVKQESYLRYPLLNDPAVHILARLSVHLSLFYVS